MRVAFSPIIETEVAVVTGWTYPPPFDFYDWDPDDDPRLLTLPVARYFVARDESGALAGFACFGESAQVPSGAAAGLYRGDLLDIGLGLRPELTGRGLGLAYVHSVIALGTSLFAPAGFRLSVAAFNQRAIRTYQRAGFVVSGSFDHLHKGESVRFFVMERTTVGILSAMEAPYCDNDMDSSQADHS
jgi:ribosomal-protein-alanine N-acetyltransferase